jgi:hypothetical protein
MAAAVDELVDAELLSRLPDGRLHRRSPAEQLVSLTGVPSLTSWVDPMGGDLACRSLGASIRPVPDAISSALGVAPSEPVRRVRCLWDRDGQPAAVTNTFLVARRGGNSGGRNGDPRATPLGVLRTLDDSGEGELANSTVAGTPAAVHLELTLVARSIAHLLALPADRPAATLTVRLDDPDTRRPVAVTSATLRPELFRIVVQTVDPSGQLNSAQHLEAVSDLVAGDP